MKTSADIASLVGEAGDPHEELLNRAFFALSDPLRRSILERLSSEALLVSEIAAPFNISLQAVSRHIQVLVRAGLVRQERSGRISRCSLTIGPMFAAAVWINRYSKYWQAQFDTLAAWLKKMEQDRPGKSRRAPRNRQPRPGLRSGRPRKTRGVRA